MVVQIPARGAVVRRLAGALAVAIGLAVLYGQCGPAPARAQVVVEDPCSEKVLRRECGDDWHVCYFTHLCWLMEPAPATFVIGGRR